MLLISLRWERQAGRKRSKRGDGREDAKGKRSGKKQNISEIYLLYILGMQRFRNSEYTSFLEFWWYHSH